MPATPMAASPHEQSLMLLVSQSGNDIVAEAATAWAPVPAMPVVISSPEEFCMEIMAAGP